MMIKIKIQFAIEFYYHFHTGNINHVVVSENLSGVEDHPRTQITRYTVKEKRD